MKILHINTHDITGGAAKAAYRLHKGIQQLGYNSSMFVLNRFSHDPSIKAFIPHLSLSARLYRKIRGECINRSFFRYMKSRPDGYELFSDNRTKYSSSFLNQLPSYDVINLHWIAGFVDYRTFFSKKMEQTPIVWTLHDMNAFTGGCHYDLGCGKYNSGCGSCPQLGSSSRNDLSRIIWKQKKRILSNLQPDQLHLITLNKWMTDEVSKSPLLNRFPVSLIPNGLDTELFNPRDKQLARKAFELPPDARIVLFIADSVTNRRKGFTLLTKALKKISHLSDLFLISIGSGHPAIEVQIPHIHLGYIDNNRLLSLAYSAADLFVIPSVQDNLPNTVLESMACGTPIVGFDVGGIPDMVRPGITGMLAPAQNVTALQTTIIDLIQDGIKLKEMAINCRRIAVEEYSMKVQARCYIQLYNQILH